MRDKNASNNKKKDIDWLRVLVAIDYPLPAAAILFSIYYILYLGMDIIIFLILAILTVLAYLGVAIILLKPLPEDKKYSPFQGNSAGKPDPSSDKSSALAAGILGGILLDQALRKRTRSTRSDENDFLWQEKIRKDMR